MLQPKYEELSETDKIGLLDVVNNATLYELLDSQIKVVAEELCNLSQSGTLAIEYAIIQQRLISLRDLRDFFKRVRIDTSPHLKLE